MSTVTDPSPVIAWPVQRITTRQYLTARAADLLRLPAPRTGRHRADRARKPADVSYLLSPAAVQLITRTAEHLPADPDQDTGLLNPAHVRPTGAFTPTRGERES